MKERTVIAAAGNTAAPALAVLGEMGYRVSRRPGTADAYLAESESCTLLAESLLELVGLAKLFEMRGLQWQPSDAEVSALLALEGEA